MSYICCLIPKIWPHLSFGPACFIPHSFLFSCPLSPLFLFGSPVISSSFLYHTRLTCFCYSFIPSSIFLWVPYRSSFIPTLFLFPSSLPSFLSLFLPSGDAAKRKAWKLNRVSSLRSIYTNSLQNSEGKKKKLLWWDGQTPNWPPPWPSHHCRVGVPCAGDLCFWFQEWMSWWFAEKDDETGFKSLTCLSKKHWDTFITWRLIL